VDGFSDSSYSEREGGKHMNIVQSFMTQNPCYKTDRKIQVKGLMLHSVGCPQPSAETFIKIWNKPESSRACVHAFIDGNTGRVYQTLPWDHRGWHGGGESNNSYIGVEMCEPACIHYTGGASFTCSDHEKAMEVVKRTYDAAVELFAMLCGQFGLDPMGDGVILSHKEGHDRGIATGHADPDHLWMGMNSGYTMDGFRRDVAAAMADGSKAEPGQTPEKQDSQGEAGTNAPSSTAGAGQAPADGISAGDQVKVRAGAVYYNSEKPVPDWVTNDVWIVKSVSGDRAVIDNNVSGTSAVNSPIKVSNLIPVKKAAETEPAADTPVQRPSGPAVDSVQGAMRISDGGVALVAKYEGCRLKAYKCPAGVWTIGYGHTAGVNEGDTLPSEEAARELLKKDLARYAGCVNNCVKKGLITFPLTQNQFDALTSFCYNCGEGSLQRLVSGRDAAAIAEKIPAYNKGGGRVLEGLVKRREEERKLFLGGEI